MFNKFITLILCLSVINSSKSMSFLRSFEQKIEDKENLELSLLPEQSIVREFCRNNKDDYHCIELRAIFYCAITSQNTTLAHMHCCKDNSPHGIMGKDFWSLSYHVKKICQNLNVSHEETVKEINDLIQIYESIERFYSE